jgi:hypothetical protein
LPPDCDIEHELPVEGAVISIHDPLVADSVPDPDFSVHSTWFVLPLATVAKILRVEPGITLNPNSGWPTAIETLVVEEFTVSEAVFELLDAYCESPE